MERDRAHLEQQADHHHQHPAQQQRLSLVVDLDRGVDRRE